ncbi:MAG: GMC oxidoreductase [Acidobacteriota bacterium]
MPEVVIIGSGCAGTAAALSLAERGIRPCILDVGEKPPSRAPIQENVYAHCRENDCFSLFIGDDFAGLDNLTKGEEAVPAKLVSPGIAFVTAGAEARSPLAQEKFDLIQSFARGGLANAWGAGLYRFTQRDFEGFPIGPEDLRPYYDRLSREIGISGTMEDDLLPYFGDEALLQPPLRLSQNASRILSAYERKRPGLNGRGVFMGRPRLGVLSEPYGGREACDYANLEFWEPNLPHIYTPRKTLDRLIREERVDYRSGLLVRRWDRVGDDWAVRAESVRDGSPESVHCRRLILAAGAAGSARLALASRNDHVTRLPLLDNPTLQFPFVLPGRIGAPLETDAFGLTQLNLILDGIPDGRLYQGSLLEVTSPARAEFFPSFPLAARDNLRLIRFLLPAMCVLQLFGPAGPESAARFSLRMDGKLEIRGGPLQDWKPVIRTVLSVMRRLGVFSHSKIVVRVFPGHGIHYAGTLPMRNRPGEPYACSPQGELNGMPGVYVADGAAFPRLPAKNFSFAVMANAMRTAEWAAESLKETA